ncbi:N-acetylmuramoyl-L-alanine amidase [Rhodovulum sp. PH10]|nr:N-acetylmuramoyl-L-alanine amidase [Rhodovulum sp. PH10]
MSVMPNEPPDSPLVARVVPSPNREPRVGVSAPDILLLHYTGMADTDEALARLCDPAAKVSSHHLVREDGTVLQLVPEHLRAWHAGLSSWEGVADVNSRSIGIEIANPGHDFGCPPFPERQIAAVIALCADICRRWRIRPDRVLAHSDVAPTRKRDPGETFPWESLAREGVGLWVASAPLDTPGAALSPGDAGDAVLALQRDLAAFGYGVAPTGRYDDLTVAVVTALQRHFRPARVDGVADASTRQTLSRVLEMSGSILRVTEARPGLA